MKTKLYTAIASISTAIKNCDRVDNQIWKEKHKNALNALLKEHLPHGCGIDNGCSLLYASDRVIKISFDYHHMDNNGYYNGWTSHILICKPSFSNEIKLKITGKDVNQIKDYLYDVFSEVLTQEIEY